MNTTEEAAPISVIDFNTYEEYLDSQITPVDLFYLEDKELARQLVELGYRGSGEPLKREEFEARKKASLNFGGLKNTEGKSLENMVTQLSSAGKEEIWQDDPFLSALASREEANRTGKMMTIIFLRASNAKGQEISSYVDYAHRLKTENFDAIFNLSKKLMPRSSDLSFYNWVTHQCTSNHSPNFTVITDDETGLLFKSKKDRKIINVDPKIQDGTQYLEIKSDDYVQIVLFDHVTRKKL